MYAPQEVTAQFVEVVKDMIRNIENQPDQKNRLIGYGASRQEWDKMRDDVFRCSIYNQDCFGQHFSATVVRVDGRGSMIVFAGQTFWAKKLMEAYARWMKVDGNVISLPIC